MMFRTMLVLLSFVSCASVLCDNQLDNVTDVNQHAPTVSGATHELLMRLRDLDVSQLTSEDKALLECMSRCAHDRSYTYLREQVLYMVPFMIGALISVPLYFIYSVMHQKAEYEDVV